MKSRTSFYSVAALKKDVTRFAPVWGLYSVFLSLILLLGRNPGPKSFLELVNGGFPAVINFLYAPICAVTLFGDLYQSRMCNMLHSLPIRREGWFCVHVSAGLLFSLAPNALLALAAFAMLDGGISTLLWFLVMTLHFLFFFGAACLAVFCVGSRFAMVTVYSLMNFLGWILYGLSRTLLEPVLYGVVIPSTPFYLFSPMIRLEDAQLFFYGESLTAPSPCWEDLRYLLIVAGVGCAFIALALVLYRRRALECAGDFIALRPLSPVFLVLYTLSVGAVLYAASELTATTRDYAYLVVGILVGFFTGKMLLERTVKVFKLKSFLQFGALAAALFLILGAAWLDPMGVTQYVPKADEVEAVAVYTQEYSYLYPDGEDWQGQNTDIQRAVDLHSALVEEGRPRDAIHTLYLRYRLKDGKTVLRRYRLAEESDACAQAKRLLSDWRYLFQTDEDWQTLCGRITGVSVSGSPEEITDPALLEGLLAAIRVDADAGRMAQSWPFHMTEGQREWLTFSYTASYGLPGSCTLWVYDSCTSTLAFLADQGLLPESEFP